MQFLKWAQFIWAEVKHDNFNADNNIVCVTRIGNIPELSEKNIVLVFLVLNAQFKFYLYFR